MRDVEILDRLTAYTVMNSCFDTQRDYLGLSQLHRCNVEIWNAFYEGRDCSVEDKLKCYKGYQMERDLMHRLENCFPGDCEKGASQVIKAHGGLVQGHPDFYLFGKPGDFKSVAYDAHLPKTFRAIPFKVVKQLQAYMLFLPASAGYVIYESRESGVLRVYSVVCDRYLQGRIGEQVVELVNAVSERRLPKCGCRKCLANN